MNSQSTEQPVALVTGASRGIGRTVAAGLARRGYRVAALARHIDTVGDSGPEGGSVTPYRCDVTDDQAVATVVERVVSEWGCIDVLFNNAGIVRKGTLDLTADDFDAQLNTNLRAAWLVMKAVAPQMQRRGTGHIINLASRSGKFGFPNVGAYAATKFGLVGLNESLMKELAPQGIKVTAICPSWVDTDMADEAGCTLPPEEMIQPEDILRTIDWLLALSPAACVQDVVLFCRLSISSR